MSCIQYCYCPCPTECNYTFCVYGLVSCYSRLYKKVCRSVMVFLLKQGRLHGRFSRVLLGRGSNNTVYTASVARRVVTDCLHCSNSLIAQIQLIFATSDWLTDRSTDWLIESRLKKWTQDCCLKNTNNHLNLSYNILYDLQVDLLQLPSSGAHIGRGYPSMVV